MVEEVGQLMRGVANWALPTATGGKWEEQARGEGERETEDDAG